MRRRFRSGERGVAMATAIALAIIVALLVSAVLSLTWRRFELSAHRTDHEVAKASAEAGFQYVFARMDRDTTFADPAYPAAQPGFRNVIDAASPAGAYVISCDPAVAAGVRLIPALHMGGRMQGGELVGGKHVTVRIQREPAPRFADRPYIVRSSSTYGTGGA